MFKGIVETYINKLEKKSESPVGFERGPWPSEHRADALPTKLEGLRRELGY